MAMPEQDGWEYTGEETSKGSDGLSFVCSSYVSWIYKAGGLYNGHIVNATEQTPRDIYQLDIFDKNFKRPQVCIDADPNIPYCQLIGNYRMSSLPGYNTITPYDHMNEKCPSAPGLPRIEGC